MLTNTTNAADVAVSCCQCRHCWCRHWLPATVAAAAAASAAAGAAALAAAVATAAAVAPAFLSTH